MNYFRNAISKLYDAVSAPVASTRDALAERLKRLCVIPLLLCITERRKNWGMVRHQQHFMISVEEEAKQDYIGLEDIKHLYGREKETQGISDGIEDMQYLFDGHDMQLIKDGRRVKTWRLTGNLNQNLTDTICIRRHLTLTCKPRWYIVLNVRYIKVVVKLESITRQKVLLEH